MQDLQPIFEKLEFLTAGLWDAAGDLTNDIYNLVRALLLEASNYAGHDSKLADKIAAVRPFLTSIEAAAGDNSERFNLIEAAFVAGDSAFNLVSPFGDLTEEARDRLAHLLEIGQKVVNSACELEDAKQASRTD